VLGVEGINQRIAQITTQIASLSPAPVAAPPAHVSVRPGGFAAALDRAVTVETSRAAPAPKASTMRAGIPSDLAGYGNGRIPPGSLSPIGVGQHRLWAPAAQSFRQMTAAAHRQGITIGVSDSYRSFDQQVEVARRKGLYSKGGLAAEPGTSDHGWGLSLDLSLNREAQSWMRANAGKYGFHENVAREPWHWTFAS
jgi:zinc D-Ala-D-Ala carboxypeptidase